MKSRKDLVNQLKQLKVDDLGYLSQNEFESIQKTFGSLIEKIKTRKLHDQMSKLESEIVPSRKLLYESIKTGHELSGSPEEMLRKVKKLVETTNKRSEELEEILVSLRKKPIEESLSLIDALTEQQRIELSLIAHVTDEKGKRKKIPASKKGKLKWLENVRNVKTRGVLSRYKE